MTVQFLFWVIVAVFVAACVICLQVGYRLGLEDRESRPDKYDRFWPDLDQEPDLEPDRFELAVSAFIESEPVHERLADTGELQRLYERPYPMTERLRSTGELRALAYNGDMGAIAAQVDEWKKEIDTA